MSVSLYELSQRINSAIPVGTIVAYYGTTAPNGWLICDGRSCAGTELAKMIGNNVPDLRGRFLRMIGGNAAGMGIAQGDCIRNITGEASHFGASIVGFVSNLKESFYGKNTKTKPVATGVDAYSGGYSTLALDVSRQVPTGPENRPINMAFNFIIKANLYYRLVFLSHLNNMFRGE